MEEFGNNISNSKNLITSPQITPPPLSEDELKKGVFLKSYYDYVDKYGPPIETLNPILHTTEAFLFEKKPYKVAIYFREKTAVKLDYYRSTVGDNSSGEEERRAILNANSNGQEWSKGVGLEDYVRSDRKVGAYTPKGKYGWRTADIKVGNWKMSVADLEWVQNYLSFKKQSEINAKKELEDRRRQDLKGL